MRLRYNTMMEESSTFVVSKQELDAQQPTERHRWNESSELGPSSTALGKDAMK